MIVSKKTSFSAAHYLPNHFGPCQNLHGHTWTIELAVDGNPQDDGIVVDFAVLKGFLSYINDQFDHTLLNDIITNPTAENICLYIKDKWDSDDWGQGPVALAYIRVWETEDSMIEYRP